MTRSVFVLVSTESRCRLDDSRVAASRSSRASCRARVESSAAHPDKVRIELAGREVDVAAKLLHSAAREQARRQFTSAATRLAQYQEKTDCQLPIIRLAPGL